MTTVAGPATGIAEKQSGEVYSTTRERARRRRQGRAALFTGIQAAVIVIWCLLPFYWMVVIGLRDPRYTFDPNPLPSHLTFENYVSAFDTANGNYLGLALANSFFICLVVTVIALVVGISASYALARLNFTGKGLVMGFILGASMFPGVALLTPLFKMFTDLGWSGQYQVLIIPYIAGALPLTVYTLNSFFREMPWELEEAARIDGCTPAQAFRIVILPLAAPAVFTTAILAFIASWNEYLLVSVLGNTQIQTVTYAIAQFTGSIPHTQPYTTIMAAGTIVTIPLIVLVLIFQRRIVAGLTAGGVKG
ncbi:carbohydrate ABC transporter permease [Amnibacterium sp. CER49]|uniref:carbohydrate ABC transporter permease n=1 Tax=Amnibacterium sp. CER49 TaxID=3039161 RepID=UPI00244927D6|nr:carbohydrate ABC transporter permease [Amnibacterium sp. CER49]MDH2443265.1 carbohydrate ABC transporter permease [Amnibacterium sp. CER49]